MAKTQEELTQLKKEYETLNNKLKELTEDELRLVTGGSSLGQTDCDYQPFIQEGNCAQEASTTPEGRTIEYANSNIKQLNQKIVQVEVQKYVN